MANLTIKRILFLVIFFQSLVVYSQNINSINYTYYKPIEKKKLQSDFLLFQKALEEGHPGLYVYHPKVFFDSLFTSTYRMINRDLNELEFYRLLMPVIAAIGCGHTTVSLSDNTHCNFLLKVAKVFPYAVHFTNFNCFIKNNFGVDRFLQNGDKIIKINGMESDAVLKKMFDYIEGDGYIQTSKYFQINKHFPLYYMLIFGERDTFELEVMRKGKGTSELLSIPAISVDSLRNVSYSYLEKQNKSNKQLVLTIKKDKDYAVLDINSFSQNILQLNEERYRRVIKKSFKNIRRSGVNNLVIDIRDNRGGEDVYVNYLLKYLMTKKYRIYHHSKLRTGKKLSYSKYTDKALLYNTYIRFSIKGEDDAYYFRWRPIYRWQKPYKRNHFNGNVYLLLNGGSFSASVIFATILNFHERAVIVGEESGGDYTGCNGDLYPLLTLPETKIRIVIPIARQRFEVGSNLFFGRGIMPAYQVNYVIDDVLNNNDLEMNLVEQLILQQNK